MRSIILCEGADDAYILGYYLHKTSENPQWDFCSSETEFAKSYKLEGQSLRKSYSLYKRGDDVLAIWPVGGKNSFDKPLNSIYTVCTSHPEEKVDTLFLLSDRDDDSIRASLDALEAALDKALFHVSLHNEEASTFSYIVEDDEYTMQIIPVVIPFEKNGALETVLMQAIADTSDEDRFITDSAIRYVQTLLSSGKLQRYLQHDREILKAEYSSVIAITNPDRSTATFDHLLMTHPWETKHEIQRHFDLFREVLTT